MSQSKVKIFINTSSPDGDQTYETSKSEFVFGRSGKADIKVDDSGISREHFKVKLENDALHIQDLNSLNGVYIDGYKINPMQYIAFQEKSTLSFGKCPLTLKIRYEIEKPDEARTVIYTPSASSAQSAKAKEEIPKTPAAKTTLQVEEFDEFEVVDSEKLVAAPVVKTNVAGAINISSQPSQKSDIEEIHQGKLVISDIKASNEKHDSNSNDIPNDLIVNLSNAEVENLKINQESLDNILLKEEPKKDNILVKTDKKTDPKQDKADTKDKTAKPNSNTPPLTADLNKNSKAAKEKTIDDMTDEQIIAASRPEEKAEFEKLIDISAFPKKDDEYKLSFRNVGLEIPKQKPPSQQAKEIIREAEYQKRAIIKSAEVFKSRTINETRIQAKKASEEAHAEFKRLVDTLLENTRIELKKLRTDTEILLDEKRIQANEEIQRVWEQHEEQIRIDKEKQYDSFEKENKIKLDLSIEKARSDMFAERHKIITDAENEVLQKKRAFQVEIENEKTEHLIKIKTYNEELNKTQTAIEENKKILKESKASREEAELELSKTLSLLKAEKESLTIVQNSFKETEESHKKIEHELATFNETKQKAIAEIEKTQNELNKLNNIYANLTEKKQLAEEELQRINDQLKDARAKAKAEVEAEYANLRNNESKKFEDFRVNELKELQKIRDAHSDSIKNYSVDLSQEIATKLELLASKSGYTKFDFEKHFELINSVIQIKGAVNTGSESKHAQQLESWKNRKRKENFSLIARGFAAGLVCVLAVTFGYKKLNIDPVQAELARIAADNKAKDVENQFIPTKTDQYYDTYLETTLYTNRFSEVYLDDKNQQEWVNYATKYFLRQWKVDEEKVIEVISNSNALVQNVVEEIPKLKKTKIKKDLEKLKEIENEYIQKQAAILGSSVRYDAYKKIEKEFFQSKLQGRVPASQD